MMGGVTALHGAERRGLSQRSGRDSSQSNHAGSRIVRAAESVLMNPVGVDCRKASSERGMSTKHSAGLLMYRGAAGALEVFLVHPGGPFFARKDAGVWSIPKGEIEADEDPPAVAAREFHEETGRTMESCRHSERLLALGEIKQRGGKVVTAWAFEGDWPDGVAVESNTFELEWPPHSGHVKRFPEVDRGGFFELDIARERINPAQVELLDRLVDLLKTE